MDIGKYPYARLVMSQNAMQIRKRFFEGTKYEASLDSVLIFDGILYSTPASITSIRYSWLEERTYYEKHIDQSPCDSSRMVGDYVPLTREELESTLPEFMRTKKDSIP